MRSVHLRITGFQDHPEGWCLLVQTYVSVVYDYAKKKSKADQGLSEFNKEIGVCVCVCGGGGGGEVVTTYFSNTLRLSFS